MFRRYTQCCPLRGFRDSNIFSCKTDVYIHRWGKKTSLKQRSCPESCSMSHSCKIVLKNRTNIRTISSMPVSAVKAQVRFSHTSTQCRCLHAVRKRELSKKQRVKKHFKETEITVGKLISALKAQDTIELSMNKTTSFQEISCTIDEVENTCFDGFALDANLSSKLLDELCRHSLFDFAYRFLCILDDSETALHVHYIRLANSAAVGHDITVAANVCNLAYKKGFCIDFATCKFTIHGLCDRSLIAFELSKMLQEEPLNNNIYRANEFANICKKDTELAVVHLLNMIEQKEILPDQSLFMEVIQILVIQHNYYEAASVLSMMRRYSEIDDREGSQLEEISTKDSFKAGKVDVAALLEIETRLDQSGAKLKGNMDFYEKIAPDIYEKIGVKYDFNETEEDSLFKAWNHRSLKGWGPYFILRECSFGKRADNTLGPMTPVSPDANGRERRKKFEDVSIYHGLKLYRKRNKTIPPLIHFLDHNRFQGITFLQDFSFINEELLEESGSETIEDDADPEGRRYYIDIWRESYLEDCGAHMEELDEIIEKINNDSLF
mmetsp:Transcript_24658/g.30169  ORF Transcript_24658/g.30169 Transcript_24658/m.30169 type:complete len:551 (-) Transcript_24658:1020-2672(-)